eukprot:68435-Prymnesium_polylepis.1
MISSARRSPPRWARLRGESGTTNVMQEITSSAAAVSKIIHRQRLALTYAPVMIAHARPMG